MHSERQLLFGILAFQNGCLSREALLSGLNIWRQDRSRSLVDVLRKQGTLSDDAADLLQQLVELHVQQHGNDPQQSLGSLSSLGSLRQELEQLGDAEIAATLTHIPASAAAETVIPSQVDSEQTFVPSEGALTGDGARLPHGETRFRILRPHARGGLGEVFVARDEELNRDVALKEIRGEHADNKDSRGRFVLEAEITGGLEHPGIVPVYGLGQYADGRPYYAMRFIQGDSLQEAIREYHSDQDAHAPDSERTLQLRKLLGRFIDVCQAIGYAHSRGVLHRDLKPGNIMLGKYGETLVVDWGLAKVKGREDVGSAETEQSLRPLSGEGVTPTMMGSALGTPAYMPPEQAAGKLDELGPASDVYSLGATLYHLLTGKAPFQADTVTALLQAVQQGTFPRPTEIKANVPKSLEAVCLKAMALKPRDRYVTPQELADDIERYLADEPVQAFPEPFSVRAKRWVRKHPTLTTTSAAVVLLSAVGLGTFSTILGAKNTELSGLNDQLGDRNTELADKNAELDQANQDLTAANAREHEARTLAETNEQSARQQSQLALQTLTSVIFDVQTSFENLPGGGEVRRRLLTTSLEKLEQVATEYVAQATVDRNTLTALMEMGNVILSFGVGEEATNLMSDVAAAEPELSGEQQSAVELAQQFYMRAHDIAERLATADPTNAQAQRDLSVSYNNLGEVQIQLGDTQSALGFYQQSLDIFERLAAVDPNNAEAQRNLSISYNKLGDVQLQLGDTQAALEFYQQSLDIKERLATADPTNAQAQRDLSVSYGRLGDVQLQLGNTQSALGFYQQSLDIDERLAAADPTNAQAQRDLSVSYFNLGDVQRQLGETQSALGYYQQCNDILERLAAADPLNSQAQRDLSVSYNKLGDVQLKLGDTQLALGFFQQSLDIRERLAAADPTDAQAQRDLSVSYHNLGDVQLKLGETQAALGYYGQCNDILERLAAADPTDAQAQRDLSVSYHNLGDVQLKLGETQAALGYYGQCNDILERLAAADPTNAQAQRDLSVSYDNQGNVQQQLGDTQSALGYYQQGLDVRERLAAADPTNSQVQRDLSVSYERLGNVQLQLGETQSALGFYQQGLDIRERLSAADPNNAQAQRDLSISYEKLGDVQLLLGETAAALGFYQQGLDIRERLSAADPNDAQAQRDLMFSHYKLGDVQLQLGDTQSALGFYQQGLDIRERLAAADPTNSGAQRDLMVSHYKLAQVTAAMLEYDTAVERYTTAIAILDRMIANGQNVAQSQHERETVANALRTVEREAAKARVTLADWETFISHPTARWRLSLRIRHLACTNRFDEIPQTAAMLRSLYVENPTNLYSAACGYAVCAGAIQAAEGESLSGDQQTRRQEYIDLALACLRESIAAGWNDFDHMQQDSDLAVLRDLSGFEELMSIPPPPPLVE